MYMYVGISTIYLGILKVDKQEVTWRLEVTLFEKHVIFILIFAWCPWGEKTVSNLNQMRNAAPGERSNTLTIYALFLPQDILLF